MPVEREHIQAFSVLLLHSGRQGEYHHGEQPQEACAHVEGVKTDERVISRAKKICGDGQAYPVNQAMPLASGADQKGGSQSQRQKPKEVESCNFPAVQGAYSQVNGQAARKQANRIEDRNFKDLLGGRPAEALSDIKKVGNDENREDGRFARDEREHSHTASRRKRPRRFHDWRGYGQRAHVLPLKFRFLFKIRNMPGLTALLIPPVRIFRMLDIPKWPPALHFRNYGKVVYGWRRRSRPFQGPRVPWIIARRPPLKVRPEQVEQEAQQRRALEQNSGGYDHVPGSPPSFRLVGVDAPRHSQHSRTVHEVESEVEPDQEQPKVPFAESLVEHPPAYFRIPVVE